VGTGIVAVSVIFYATVEPAIKAWLGVTSLAPLLTRPDGGLSIYLAMPPASPLPSVILTRVGGGPHPRKDLPEDRPRISFDCWGTSRDQAAAVAGALVSECESLAPAGGHEFDGVCLLAAEVVTWLWLPDPNTDTPRYVVDALFTTVTRST
jgi:Protein of unknown function (DUF3168)